MTDEEYTLVIPPITDPLGRYWKQPDVSAITFRNSKAIMTADTYAALVNYTSSLPSGTYSGKMWRADDTFCWYGDPDGDQILIHRYPIVVLPAYHKRQEELALAILVGVANSDHVVAGDTIFTLKQTHPEFDWDDLLKQAMGIAYGDEA